MRGLSLRAEKVFMVGNVPKADINTALAPIAIWLYTKHLFSALT